ncbi:hypothetical protein O181_115235 [Austropuccinia psidii MF-1]|uniref:Uncharacterized protein n=1 Tax=Austropuccinia psidii MF-1 TaxID=1389203 RepID=A0A9Q3K624_9BASI|nr:hypothetical protein [Austropuccinia psidii MF-1]
MVQSGPFCLSPMRPKGGSPLALKARWVLNHNWDHLSPISATITMTPKMAIDHHRTQIGQGSPRLLVTTGSAWLNPSPKLEGGTLFIPPCTPYSRLQEWCMYGIKYHYAPFLLSNSMVAFSGPNSMIPNQGPKIQRPF